MTLSGANWQPGEAVHIFVNDDVGQTWSYSADVNADSSGSFTNQFQLPNWFIATYTVTATGVASGTATTTFTDASGPSSTVTFPTAGSYYNDAAWDAGCASAGFCGTATGGSSGGAHGTDFNVTGVSVAISKGTGGATRWWDGGGFNATSQTFVAATLSGSGHGPVDWSYAFGHAKLPEENQYKVVPQASDDSPGTESGNSGKTFLIDRRAPLSLITCNSAACSGTYSGNVTVGLSASDPSLGSTAIAGSGVQKIAYTTDGSDPTSSGTATTISGSSGSFVISLTKTVKWAAYDNAGNVSGVQSQTITIGTPDTTAPTISYSQSPDGSHNWFKTAPAKVTVHASDPDDNVSSIDCTLDGSPASLSNTSGIGSSGTASGDISTSTEGDHVVSCTATDTHSNTTNPAQTTHLKLDKTAPRYSCSSTPPSGWSNSEFSTSCTASDTGGSDNVTPASFNLFTNVGAGNANASASTNSVSISDDAGNTTNAQFTGIKIDLSPPSITKSIQSGPHYNNGTDDFVKSSTTLRVNVSEVGSGLGTCTISIDGPGSNDTTFACGAGNNDFSLADKLSSPPDGSYSISVDAEDNAGNRERPARGRAR